MDIGYKTGKKIQVNINIYFYNICCRVTYRNFNKYLQKNFFCVFILPYKGLKEPEEKSNFKQIFLTLQTTDK